MAYDAAGADELCFLDITASHENRDTIFDVVARTAEHCFMPVTVGGGVRQVEDIRKLLLAGADKVSINTAAVNEPRFRRAGRRQVRQPVHRRRRSTPSRCRSAGRSRPLGNLHPWRPQADRHRRGRVRRERGRAGAGEILLTSMDRDGTKAGFDLELTRAIADAVHVPVIASGGVGTLDHLVDGVSDGHASAVLAASIFHFGTYTIAEAKALHGRGTALPCGSIDAAAGDRANDRLHPRRPRTRSSRERGRSGDPSSYRQARCRGHGQAPRKKLGEEAVETVIAAVDERPGRPGRGERRPALPLLVCSRPPACRWPTSWPSSSGRTAQSGHRRKGVAAGLKSPQRSEGRDGSARAGRTLFALSLLLRPRMGELPRRQADDADRGRRHRGCGAQRSDRARRGASGSTCRCRACSTLYVEATQALFTPAPALLQRRRAARCPSSSASPARWRSASRPPRASCKALLARWPSPKVDLVTTDGFLLPNAVLRART